MIIDTTTVSGPPHTSQRYRFNCQHDEKSIRNEQRPLKLREVSQALGDTFTLSSHRASAASPRTSPETNPRSRATPWPRALHTLAHGPHCFVDDTGLEVERWSWRAGRALGTLRHGRPTTMRPTSACCSSVWPTRRNRRARFRTAIALTDGDGEHLFRRASSRAASHAGARRRLRLRPAVRPGGEERTFAQMSAEEKNAISHRGRAVRLLAEYLRGGKR